MCYASPEVRRVSQADKLNEHCAILADCYRDKEAVWNKFKGGKEGTLWFYRSLLAVYQGSSPSFLSNELERVIRLLEQLTQE
ncbi:hypothetical protein CDG77_31325 [Nostoc sp. 'Peltigera membranacea cyanobiont' 213]|uniref:hypothetical protein n=1 Tax=Nostoc sp. 'Peltigera membranacea cyanobiont' 213 TaxID=2014530 RepID=UPI000B95BFA2|nr:hypothetical protein [Nostoc sp. 'Peltigera membranacea cyanobiont' 213]OYD87084.1 hypothetical protein CDG77_31325 [Nostoc sp. 'Peltigera membranacea cyanobiont' 213]